MLGLNHEKAPSPSAGVTRVDSTMGLWGTWGGGGPSATPETRWPLKPPWGSGPQRPVWVKCRRVSSSLGRGSHRAVTRPADGHHHPPARGPGLCLLPRAAIPPRRLAPRPPGPSDGPVSRPLTAPRAPRALLTPPLQPPALGRELAEQPTGLTQRVLCFLQRNPDGALLGLAQGEFIATTRDVLLASKGHAKAKKLLTAFKYRLNVSTVL